MDIRLYTNDQIDKEHWDLIIFHAHNGMVYAESVYLDHMFPQWSALIDADRQIVMPLPLKRKWGISYAFQPVFMQQLGVFAREPLPDMVVRKFIATATAQSRATDLYLNHGNKLEELSPRTNYVLSLNESFDDIKARFRRDLISKSKAAQVRFEAASIAEAVSLYKQEILGRNRAIRKEQITSFYQLAEHLSTEGRCFARRVVDKEGRTLSAGLFFKDHRRIYFLIGASNKAGREVAASAYKVYETIREFSGTDLLFDFGGSEIPGVKAFFQKFSPVNQPYYRLQKGEPGRLQRMAARMLRRKN